MEDYKQKYESALKVASKWHKDGIKDIQSVIECIFPELKESEDERMIKLLKRLIKAYYDVNFPTPEGFEREDMIAWLEKAVTPTSQDWNDYKDKPVELWNMYVKGLANGIERGKQAVKNHPQDYGLKKQGEPKPTDDNVEAKFKVGDTIVEKDVDECDYETIKDIKNGRYIFTDGYCMNIDEQEGWQLVKTPAIIEQKPVDKCIGCNNFKGCITCTDGDQYAHITEQKTTDKIKPKKKLKNIKQTYFQKQEWTGYDEKAYEIALLDIDKSPSMTKNDTINWLKSLKNRVQSQLNQGWSEEDDYILNLVSKFISKGYKSHPKIPSLEFVQDWLKSLKERMKGE